MKLALVYDRVNKLGGAERVLTALHEVWPEAPLYTSVYDKASALWVKDIPIKTSFIQYIPFAKHHHELFPWLMNKAFSSMNISDYDVVVSVTSAEAKNIRVSPRSLHICYCLTPTRYLWSHKNVYETDGIKGQFLKVLGPLMRTSDYESAQRVSHFIAISHEVQRRISKYYHRQSEVIYPPVAFPDQEVKEDKQNHHVRDEPFYLVVSRLVSYKRIDLAIEACQKLNRKLVVIGEGSDYSRLKRLSSSLITFTGQLTDREIASYYMQCRAVIFPGWEDFGIVPVEAQAYGKPVLAYAKGGALETVINGKTGILFDRQEIDALITVLKIFEVQTFDSKLCRENARRFAKERFKKEIKNFINKAWENHCQAF